VALLYCYIAILLCYIFRNYLFNRLLIIIKNERGKKEIPRLRSE
jgi:hypothetical protein